ncbi:MAG: hypothetical protein SOW10_06520, partial [Alloprevotella sp.]|nr:hypothetical protein [Alloprevotella sp.]
MSIDMALSTRRGVGRDTYSLPQEKRGCAASGTSMDMPLLNFAPVPRQWTWHYYAAFLRNVKRVCILRLSDGKVYL